jgi:hypothetical protein
MIPIRFSFFRELIGILFKEEERNRQKFMHLNNITELEQGISKCPTNTVLVGECRAMKKSEMIKYANMKLSLTS